MNILSLIKLLKPFAKNIAKKQKPIVTNINKKTIPELDNSGKIVTDNILTKKRNIALDPKLRPSSLQSTADEKALINLLNGYTSRATKQLNPSLTNSKKPRGIIKGITSARTQKQQALDKANKANKNIIKEELENKEIERYRRETEKHYKKIDADFRKEQKIKENIKKVVAAGIPPALVTTTVGSGISALGNKIQYDENKKLERKNEKLQKDLNNVKDELSASDWANRRNTIKSLENDLRIVNERNNDLEKKLQTLSSSEQKKEIDNLKSQLQELDKKRGEDISKYVSQMSDQDGRHASEIKRLTDTNKDLETKVENLRQIIADTQNRKNKATKATNVLSGEMKQKAKGVLQQLQNTQPNKEINSTTNNNTNKNIKNALISLGVGGGAGFGTYGLARLLGARKPWAVGLGTTAGVVGSLIAHPDIRNTVAKYLKKNK